MQCRICTSSVLLDACISSTDVRKLKFITCTTCSDNVFGLFDFKPLSLPPTSSLDHNSALMILVWMFRVSVDNHSSLCIPKLHTQPMMAACSLQIKEEEQPWHPSLVKDPMKRKSECNLLPHIDVFPAKTGL